MRDLPFIDAHVHLWDLGRLRYPWLTPPFNDGGPNGDVAPIAASYGLTDYRAEAAGWNVIGIVHVDAGAHPADALAETDWLQDLAANEGLPSGIVAFAALDDPEVETLLAAHAARPAVRGIRHIVNWHPDPGRTYTPRDVTRDEAWARGFALLERHGLSFDLQAYPGQFSALAALIARHPGIPVIINHAGMGVDLDAAGRAEWRAGMAALAALPNVSVKLSGMGFAFRPWRADAVRGRVRETLDLFGANRALMASDFPTDRLFAGFDATLGALADAVADLTLTERRALFAGNANRVYRLGLDI
ncbi:amidohydrolase family protein [Nitrospirillum sp. BR 11163]|uniref:amidohydrolase family protein n=1 Tax=Nitrospirillum sp. BR 11163 TaxID=3104323 RepID=UPI002AFE89F1|nr:amidohydrolase family protein [Nitrospirillum sp. BR 11163]MEA1673199.1 amidohydrolase family protein [Nitrospirillum sp. BR 11163]